MNSLADFLNQLVWKLVYAAPWFLGIGLVGALIGWSPLGRLIARQLQDRRQADDLLEANTAEMAQLNRTMALLTERLDASDRLIDRLIQRDAAANETSRHLQPPSADHQIPTPH